MTKTLMATRNYELQTPHGIGSTSHVWNQENRLTQVVAADGVVSAHTYSGDGLRQSLTGTQPNTPPKTTGFVWDGMNVLHETDEAGSLSYFTDYPGVPGGLVSRYDGTTSEFFGHDPCNNARHLLNSSGGISSSYLYDAFCNLLTSSASANIQNPTQIGGMEICHWFQRAGE